MFVNVWATWCPPCIEEMPTIQQLYERLHGRGLEILAVSLDALVTNHFPLAQAEQALRAVGREGTIKPIVEPWR